KAVVPGGTSCRNPNGTKVVDDRLHRVSVAGRRGRASTHTEIYRGEATGAAESVYPFQSGDDVRRPGRCAWRRAATVRSVREAREDLNGHELRALCHTREGHHRGCAIAGGYARHMCAVPTTGQRATHPGARTSLLALAVRAHRGAAAGDGARVTGFLAALAREKRMGRFHPRIDDGDDHPAAVEAPVPGLISTNQRHSLRKA